MANSPETVSDVKGIKQGDKRVRCLVITPEKTWLDELAELVVLPVYDGELGVLAGHAPLIARLGYGELRTKLGETTHRYFVDGGFAQVRDNAVTVLTQRVVPADQFNADAATKDLEQAKISGVLNDLEFAEHMRTVDRARGMIRVARPKTKV
jgi:F-type H+-transporting ATPase subunit epsilon